MSKSFRSILVLPLSLMLLAATVIAINAVAEDVYVRDSGECGENGGNLTWTLYTDGTLTISGTGNMKKYYKQTLLTNKRSPWREYDSEIYSIVIESGVTSVGEYAFYDCDRVQTVQIPSSLHSVGKYAFDNVDALNAVYYMAPLSNWSSIGFNAYNDRLQSAQRHSHVVGGGTSRIERENEVAATCTTAGKYDRVEYCQYCGLRLGRANCPVNPLGHLYDNGVVTIPATTTTTGVKTFTCQRDPSHTYTQTIPVESRVATTIADPLAGSFYTTELTDGFDYTMGFNLAPYLYDYEARDVGDNFSFHFNLNNTVYDQDGNVFGTATVSVTPRDPGDRYKVYCSSNYLMIYPHLGYSDMFRPIALDIVQSCGDVTQTTSVYVKFFAHGDYKNFLFRDAEGKPFLIYRYDYYSPSGGKALTATEPINVLQTSYAIREWRDKWRDTVLTPFFRCYTTASGSEDYLINQSGILPVYPPKAPDAAGHYEFDHWDTDAVMPHTDQKLDLDTIGEWFDSYYPIYTYAVFYPVYDTVEHTFVEHTDVAATCETDGFGHYVCSECGYESESYVIPAGHVYDEGVITTPATCTEDGVKTYTCLNDPSHAYTEVVPATAHANAVEVAATEATATEHGHTAGTYCPDCETWLSGHEVVHNTLGERTYLDEYTEAGEQEVIIVCTVCGESGLYAMEPVTPDTPETPDTPDGPDAGSDQNGLSGIAKALRSIIDFLLRLLRWLQGSK